MSPLIPQIHVHVDHVRIGRAEDRDITAGVAIADTLRQMADQIERDIGVIPYGSGYWTMEPHDYADVHGQHLGRLVLREVERKPAR